MQLPVSSKTIPLGTNPGTRLEGGKNPPPRTIIMYKNPSLGTNTGSQKPHPRDIKLENFTNVSTNSQSDTIWNKKLCGLNK